MRYIFALPNYNFNPFGNVHSYGTGCCSDLPGNKGILKFRSYFVRMAQKLLSLSLSLSLSRAYTYFTYCIYTLIYLFLYL